MRTEMTTEQRELIEEFGLLQEQMGGTRMTGRVSGWLLLSDPPVQSLTEIAEGLGVSKAAVSGAARLLLQSRFVERVGEPGQRGDFYRALPADPDEILPIDHIRTMHRLIARGLQTVADRDQTQSNYALMHDLLEFAAFIEAELPELLARWRERRTTGSPTDAGAAGGIPPSPTGGTT
jgi:DNA-binding transcriptional regulator GbsR (MarR family)